jgi:hypothetical protein
VEVIAASQGISATSPSSAAFVMHGLYRFRGDTSTLTLIQQSVYYSGPSSASLNNVGLSAGMVLLADVASDFSATLSTSGSDAIVTFTYNGGSSLPSEWRYYFKIQQETYHVE